jgi:hypothetical protein
MIHIIDEKAAAGTTNVSSGVVVQSASVSYLLGSVALAIVGVDLSV